MNNLLLTTVAFVAFAFVFTFSYARIARGQNFLRGQIEKLELELNEDIQRIGINELIQTKAGRELLSFRNTKGDSNPETLRLLINSYVALDIPNFLAASEYVKILEKLTLDEVAIFEIGNFYTKWSSYVKLQKPIDVFEAKEQTALYKELANNGINWLNKLQNKTALTYHLLSQCYFNRWDYDDALETINKAIALSESNTQDQVNLFRFRDLVIAQKDGS